MDDHTIIEQDLQRALWTGQKQLTQLLAGHDLTLPQFFVLVSLHQRGMGCSIGNLADETYQSYPTMTGIVDRLEGRHLVIRARGDSGDRRQVVVNLTSTGRKLLDRALVSRKEQAVRSLSRFSEQERREFLRLLRLYLASFESEE